MTYPIGELKQGCLRVEFDRRLKLEFHGSSRRKFWPPRRISPRLPIFPGNVSSVCMTGTRRRRSFSTGTAASARLTATRKEPPTTDTSVGPATTRSFVSTSLVIWSVMPRVMANSILPMDGAKLSNPSWPGIETGRCVVTPGGCAAIAVAVVIRGPHVQLTREKLISLAPDVMETAVQVSEALGHGGTKLTASD